VTQQMDAASVSGLRQRKKQRTREELVEAGIRLFLTQGFESTTVDQITTAVDVSQRTFFRYFASKEALAFDAMIAAEEMFYSLVLRRPPHETPVEALRAAMRALWAEMRDDETAVDAALHLRMVRLIESTPSLLAAHLRRTEELEERIAGELARREGLDVDADPRPRLVAAVFTAVARVSSRTWATTGDTALDAMIRIMDTYLDALGPALTGDWGRR
jgi:AcrR family transcriptional regulator